MPTYEYTCKSCGDTFEVFQSFTDKPLRKHKECGGELQKIFHARGVVFKGSGFYATDSRRASSTKTASSSSSSNGKDKPAKKSSDSKTSDSKSTSSASSSKP